MLGFGTVSGSYYFADGERYGHRLPVEWEDTTPRAVIQGGWRRTLVELDRETFEAVTQAGPRPSAVVHPQCIFSERTFELLSELHETPTRDFYSGNQEQFAKHVEEPFRKLFRRVAARLPRPVTDTMESEKGVFARILKNDYGRGGTWGFYWGALYPKGGKRTEDAQLMLWLNRERLECAFHISECGGDQRGKFLRNCAATGDALKHVLADVLAERPLVYGKRHDLLGGPAGEHKSKASWDLWLDDPKDLGIHAAMPIARDEVLSLSEEDLCDRIAGVFRRLFPLVLLATLDEPMPAIGHYLEGPVPERQPAYPLEECAQETGLAEDTLTGHLRAIDRKGQAILYGPPGTGKTYLAERLAKHLVAEGDGFVDIVQFHPSYSYEDFIQGIRPRSRTEGGLDYPVVPGRFMEFCAEARTREDCCVLIIDEINRAHLSRVFGELMYLLEYRDGTVPLSSGGSLAIPRNVRLIGTMNTADRSIALVDHALRRRFAFIALYPDYEVLQGYHHGKGFDPEGLIGVLREVNQQIGDRHYHVGITYFLREDLSDQLRDIWEMEVQPYLDEYFFDQPDKTDAFAWGNVEKRILKQ